MFQQGDIEALEEFLSTVANPRNVNSKTDKMHLLDWRVQDFMHITDPEIKSKLLMMQLSMGSASPFGNANQRDPSRKVYGELKIVDNYSGIEEEHKASDHPDFQLPMTVFEAKLVDEGSKSSKIELDLKGINWITSKNKTDIQRYLRSVSAKALVDLTILRGTMHKNPRFSTLLFFEFFQKVEPISRRESYKSLDLRVQQIKVSDAELSIDSDSGKTIIDLHIQVTFQCGIRNETIYFKK